MNCYRGDLELIFRVKGNPNTGYFKCRKCEKEFSWYTDAHAHFARITLADEIRANFPYSGVVVPRGEIE